MSFKIRFSLVKSRLRREVLKLLVMIYPNTLYLQEIARSLNARADQIIGVLRGLPNRYEPSLSLINLGLVTVIKERDSFGRIRNFYKATQIGCSVARNLRLVEGKTHISDSLPPIISDH